MPSVRAYVLQQYIKGADGGSEDFAYTASWVVLDANCFPRYGTNPWDSDASVDIAINILSKPNNLGETAPQLQLYDATNAVTLLELTTIGTGATKGVWRFRSLTDQVADITNPAAPARLQIRYKYEGAANGWSWKEIDVTLYRTIPGTGG